MGNLQGPAEMMPIMRGAGCATRSWTKHSPVSHILKESPSRGKEYRYARGMHTYTSCAEQSAYIKKYQKCNRAPLQHSTLKWFGDVWGTSSFPLRHILPQVLVNSKKNSSKILKFYHPCAPHARCGSYKCSYKCCTWYSTSIRAHIYRRT